MPTKYRHFFGAFFKYLFIFPMALPRARSKKTLIWREFGVHLFVAPYIIYHTFVESAPHILEMLELITRNNPGDAYVNRILALSRKYCRTIKELSYQPVSLSQRETAILSLATEGLGRKEIAARLCISEETTKTHFKNIYRKLGVSSKVSAIKIAQDRGYLENVFMISPAAPL